MIITTANSWVSASAAEEADADSVVVAKRSGDAVIIWDASRNIAALLDKKVVDEQISTMLEIAAAKILVFKAKELSQAENIRVKVVYERTGAVSPIYKTATLMGLERLLQVNASREEAVLNAAVWEQTLSKDNLPLGITATVTGKYPH